MNPIGRISAITASLTLISILTLGLGEASLAQITPLPIAAEDDAAPWSYADGTGYVNDVVKRAFQIAKLPISQIVVPYARCKELAIRGDYVACFTTSKTPELEANLLFPKHPVINPHFVAVTTTGSPLIGCESPAWKKKPSLIYVRGYEYAPRLEAMKANQEVTVELAGSEATALQMLKAGRANAALVNLDQIKVLDMVFAQAKMSANEAKNIVVACDFGSEPSYIAFSRKNPEGAKAMAVFDSAMGEMEKSGEITALQKAWAKRSVELERTKRN